MQKLKELWDKIGVQFIKFGMVGVSNTVVSLATYYLFTFFGVYYLIANALGFVTGTLNAYYWNSKFVFKEEAKVLFYFISRLTSCEYHRLLHRLSIL